MSPNEILLETNRLLIRPYRPNDLMECSRLMQDEELFHHLDMQVMTLEAYRELFFWIIGCYETGFEGDFKHSYNITLRESGEHIGWIGVGGIEYDHSIKEIYWLIGRQHWNKGYATEAARAMLHCAFTAMKLPRVVAVCKPENTASQRVMEHIGLRRRGRVEGLPGEYDFYNGELLYALSAQEYAAM